jgi:hypothetical protein
MPLFARSLAGAVCAALAVGQASPGTDSPASGAAAGAAQPAVFTWAIADTEQFVPAECRQRVTLPPGADSVLVGGGTLRFYHVGGARDGEEVSYPREDAMGKDGGPSESWSIAGGGGGCGAGVGWRCVAASTVEWASQVTNWTVLSYPGRYRAHCPGGQRVEFEVRPAGPEGATLLAAMHARSPVWGAYIDFMNRWPKFTQVISGFAARSGLPGAFPGSPERQAALTTYMGIGSPTALHAMLAAASQLPPLLRDQVELARLYEQYGLVSAGAEGPDKVQQLAALRSGFAVLGGRNTVVGAFARYQSLLFGKEHEAPASFASLLRVARQDADLCAVARSSGAAAFRVGLFEEAPLEFGGALPPRRTASPSESPQR